MQCQSVQRKISAYIDGELDADLFRSMENHISRCGACRKLVADFKKVDDWVGGLPKFDVNPDFIGQILEKAGEPNAQVVRRDWDRSVVAPVIRFMSSFMDLLEGKDSPSTGILDEFSDFPPSSIGYIYFRLLDQAGRG
jgi:hypothetical protein